MSDPPVLVTLINFLYPLYEHWHYILQDYQNVLGTMSQFYCSAQNNGWSTDTILPRWPFCMPVILTWHLGKWQEKYIFTPLRFKRTSIYFPFMFLLVRLVRSSHYRVILNILTGQKKDMTELKFLWSVNLKCKFTVQICFKPRTKSL